MWRHPSTSDENELGGCFGASALKSCIDTIELTKPVLGMDDCDIVMIIGEGYSSVFIFMFMFMFIFHRGQQTVDGSHQGRIRERKGQSRDL